MFRGCRVHNRRSTSATTKQDRPMDAENTHQVLPWMWTSGQLSKADIDRLPGLGIQVVINLAPPNSSNALPGEAELIVGRGMSYVQIPVNWEAPLPEQFAQFAAVLRALDGRHVWVHCAKNMRVSAFTYLYRRLVLGDDEATSSFPMREVWEPNAIWRAFIDQVSEGYRQGSS